jgi:hypothetical protein
VSASAGGPVNCIKLVKIGVLARRGAACSALERFPTKWIPVRRKKARQSKKQEHDPLQFDRIVL